MQNLICAVVLGVVATGALFTKDPAKAKEPARVEPTMSVARCQAVLKDGSQCPHQAEDGKRFCWRHTGAVKAVNETVRDAGEGSRRAWQSTKTWSTNAWQATKSGWNKAVDATKESLDGARVGMVELLGGKDARTDGK